MRANVILVQYQVLREFELEFDLKDNLQNLNEGHFCVRRPKLCPGKRFERNLNLSLNTAMNTSLTSGSRCRK